MSCEFASQRRPDSSIWLARRLGLHGFFSRTLPTWTGPWIMSLIPWIITMCISIGEAPRCLLISNNSWTWSQKVTCREPGGLWKSSHRILTYWPGSLKSLCSPDRPKGPTCSDLGVQYKFLALENFFGCPARSFSTARGVLSRR